MRNSAKVTLLSFNRTGVFLYDAMMSENDVRETRCAVGVCVDNQNSEWRLELQVE